MKTQFLILGTVALLMFNSCKDTNVKGETEMSEAADTTATVTPESNEPLDRNYAFCRII